MCARSSITASLKLNFVWIVESSEAIKMTVIHVNCSAKEMCLQPTVHGSSMMEHHAINRGSVSTNVDEQKGYCTLTDQSARSILAFTGISRLLTGFTV